VRSPDAWKAAIDFSIALHIERDRAWTRHDRRGRWVVVEAMPSRYLAGAPRHVRDLVDARFKPRGRRFSSLSRARSFARLVGGTIERWRRSYQRNGYRRRWERVSPWQLVLERAQPMTWIVGALPGLLGAAP